MTECNALHICTVCGLPLQVGEFPCVLTPKPHGRGAFTNFKDDIPGGLVVENYGPHPIRFDSHSERRAYMKAHGLREKERFSPMPGTDKDPQGIPNPAGYVDAYTLENARILLSRTKKVTAAEFDGSKVLVNITSEVVDDAERVKHAVIHGR